MNFMVNGTIQYYQNNGKLSLYSSKEKYPNQNIFIILVEIKNYVYLVPYVEDDTSIFLKTIIPSRQMNKKYNKNKGVKR